MIRSVFIFVLSFCCCGMAQSSPNDFFPMEKGTRWTYSGTVEWTKDNANTVVSERKVLTVVIEDSFVVGHVKVAILKGGPWDLAFYDADRKPARHVIVSNDNEYYLFGFDDISNKLLESLRNGEWPEKEMAEHLWFTLPTDESDEFCPPEMQSHVAEHDPSYCWIVAQAGTGALPALGISKPRPWYELRFQTNPDHEIDTLVPGIGITHFIYSHHGTVSNVDIKLTRFSAPGRISSPNRKSGRTPR